MPISFMFILMLYFIVEVEEVENFNKDGENNKIVKSYLDLHKHSELNMFNQCF